MAWLTVLAFVLPYDPDEAVYKIIATGIIEGKWPYRDLFDHKPPVVYFWYLPAGLGASIPLERILAAAMSAASVPIVVVLARRWLAGRQVALAVGTYVLLLANPFLSVGANAEAFMLLPLVGSLAVPSAFAAGVLLGVAVMTKPVALAFLPMLLLLWHRSTWRVGLGAGVTCLIVSLAFLPVWGDFWDANVLFNFEYGRHLEFWGRLRNLFIPDPPALLGSLPLWYAAMVGAVYQRNRLLWLWALCGLIAVKATGFNFAHYYALLVPPSALLAGIGMDRLLQRRPSLKALGVLSVLAIVVVLAGLWFAITPPHQPLLDAVRANDGEVYVLGDRTEIYAHADRQPERRFFYSVPLAVRPDWGREMKRALRECPPDVLVIPYENLFPMDWSEEVASVYKRRAEFEDGAVLTKPRFMCGMSDVRGESNG